MVRIQPSWKPSSGFPQLPTAFRIKFQQLARYRGSSIACFFRFMFYLASTCYESSSQPFTSVFPQTGQALQYCHLFAQDLAPWPKSIWLTSTHPSELLPRLSTTFSLFSSLRGTSLNSFQHQVYPFIILISLYYTHWFSGMFILLWNQGLYLSLPRSQSFGPCPNI